ncbi:MAG: hypothetical protein ACHQIK_08810 [Candidatus Acidiferrales bacterium]
MNPLGQNDLDSFDSAERPYMKRASKKVRDEIKAGRQHIFDQMVAAMIPPEMQTPKMKKLAEKAIEAATQADGALENINSLTEDGALKVIEKLGSALPALRRVLKNATKKLPHDPGGRKKKLSDEQRGEVVKEITSLILQGLELRAAKETVARRRGVSVSTIQRVWKQRELLLGKA